MSTFFSVVPFSVFFPVLLGLFALFCLPLFFRLFRRAFVFVFPRSFKSPVSGAYKSAARTFKCCRPSRFGRCSSKVRRI